ncbi:MAG: hypothetical protein NUV87_03105 [Candidatus Roizmanbacteria bacterium]|nr:hypothetical protein [Candidatus Roizmanbacteria bacterium]
MLKIKLLNIKMKYELEERVEKFGENIIDLIKKVRITITTEPIIKH